MPDKISASQFAQQIKAKYPVYASVPDAELTQKILAKYPVYREQVELRPEPAVDIDTPQWAPAAPPAPDAGGAPSSIPGAVGSALSSVWGGIKKPIGAIVDQVQTTGKASADALRKGNVNQALQHLIAPVTQPLQGIAAQGQQLSETVQGRPQMSAQDASLTALEQLGVPAFTMKESLDKGDYLDLIGQGIGAAGMFKVPQVIGKKFNAFAERQPIKPADPVPMVPRTEAQPGVKAEFFPEPKPEPIVIPPSRPKVQKPLKARDLREEYAARAPEEATDLLSTLKAETDISDIKAFRKERPNVLKPGGKTGQTLGALEAQGPRKGGIL